MPQVNVKLNGLLGVSVENGESMIAHCVNACNPSLLNVPDRYKADIPPHVPRLLFRGATERPRGDVIIEDGAFSCGAGGTWSAVNLVGWEVTLCGLTDGLNVDGLDLLGMRTILSAIGTPEMPLNLVWPRTAARIVIPRGTVKNGTSRGRWEFGGTAAREWELHEGVVVENDANSPLYLLFRWLPQMDIVRELKIVHGGNLEIRIENNIMAQSEGDTCLGGRDFVGHYHLTASELASHPYPSRPVDAVGGPTNNAQCSPLQYRP